MFAFEQPVFGSEHQESAVFISSKLITLIISYLQPFAFGIKVANYRAASPEISSAGVIWGILGCADYGDAAQDDSIFYA